MKKLKLLLSIILVFGIIVGGYGCMRVSINKNQIESDVISYLSEKYNQSFEVLDSRLIIDPAKSTYVQLTCIDDIYKKSFRVFHKLDKTSISVYDETEKVQDVFDDFEDAEIIDEYGSVILGYKYAKTLTSEVKEDVFILCKMVLDDYYPTIQDIKNDFITSFNSWKKYAYPKIFVFYNESITDREFLIEKLQEIIPKREFSIQYVFVCSADNIDEETILSNYNEHWNKYEDFVVDEDNTIKRIDGFYSTSEDDVSNLQIIKE